MEGGYIKFKCESCSQTFWSFNDGVLPSNAVQQDFIITIAYVNMLNEGTYECKGLTDQNEIFLAAAQLKVISESYYLGETNSRS